MRASRTVGKRGARRNSEAKERFWRVRAYCQQHGLTEPTFYSWRQELARRVATARNGAPSTVASTVRSRTTSAHASRQSASSPSSAATGRKPAAAVFARLDVRSEPPLSQRTRPASLSRRPIWRCCSPAWTWPAYGARSAIAAARRCEERAADDARDRARQILWRFFRVLEERAECFKDQRRRKRVWRSRFSRGPPHRRYPESHSPLAHARRSGGTGDPGSGR